VRRERLAEGGVVLSERKKGTSGTRLDPGICADARNCRQSGIDGATIGGPMIEPEKRFRVEG
jgi:hypothetical protein